MDLRMKTDRVNVQGTDPYETIWGPSCWQVCEIEFLFSIGTLAGPSACMDGIGGDVHIGERDGSGFVDAFKWTDQGSLREHWVRLLQDARADKKKKKAAGRTANTNRCPHVRKYTSTFSSDATPRIGITLTQCTEKKEEVQNEWRFGASTWDLMFVSCALGLRRCRGEEIHLSPQSTPTPRSPSGNFAQTAEDGRQVDGRHGRAVAGVFFRIDENRNNRKFLRT